MQFDYEFRSDAATLSHNGMVASSQPLASLAGLDILAQAAQQPMLLWPSQRC